ncbi:MAG: hypothetical protein A2381_15600 [Bdellovibrionales bacterium RIFOXYB1_FULL_37_110]|nr:MAG: hypothetical protein A2417_07450 [Bdellovibrionales bacterium RIFOXYC1_FULL_37_79]OFZ57046.1 MAG: hypothetical protein A2381_15600 [Bdellovibrionales bacterium RIFOXYB1_FULL_37_110]
MSYAHAQSPVVAPEIIPIDLASFADAIPPDIGYLMELKDAHPVNLKEEKKLQSFYSACEQVLRDVYDASDGHKLFLVIMDDMRPAAGFLKSDFKKAGNVLFINKGMAKIASDPSELAFVISRELEHSTSQIQDTIDDLKAKGNTIEAALLKRAVENEDDLNAIFKRMIDTGYDPYKTLNLLEKIQTANQNSVDAFLSRAEIRADLISTSLTASRREGKLKINIKPHADIAGNLEQSNQYMNSKELLNRQLQRLHADLDDATDIKTIFKQIAEAKYLSGERDKTYLKLSQAIDRFAEDINEKRRLAIHQKMGLISSKKELVQTIIQSEEKISGQIIEVFHASFPESKKMEHFLQLTHLDRLLDQSFNNTQLDYNFPDMYSDFYNARKEYDHVAEELKNATDPKKIKQYKSEFEEVSKRLEQAKESLEISQSMYDANGFDDLTKKYRALLEMKDKSSVKYYDDIMELKLNFKQKLKSYKRDTQIKALRQQYYDKNADLCLSNIFSEEGSIPTLKNFRSEYNFSPQKQKELLSGLLPESILEKLRLNFENQLQGTGDNKGQLIKVFDSHLKKYKNTATEWLNECAKLDPVRSKAIFFKYQKWIAQRAQDLKLDKDPVVQKLMKDILIENNNLINESEKLTLLKDLDLQIDNNDKKVLIQKLNEILQNKTNKSKEVFQLGNDLIQEFCTDHKLVALPDDLLFFYNSAIEHDINHYGVFKKAGLSAPLSHDEVKAFLLLGSDQENWKLITSAPGFEKETIAKGAKSFFNRSDINKLFKVTSALDNNFYHYPFIFERLEKTMSKEELYHLILKMPHLASHDMTRSEFLSGGAKHAWMNDLVKDHLQWIATQNLSNEQLLDFYVPMSGSSYLNQAQKDQITKKINEIKKNVFLKTWQQLTKKPFSKKIPKRTQYSTLIKSMVNEYLKKDLQHYRSNDFQEIYKSNLRHIFPTEASERAQFLLGYYDAYRQLYETNTLAYSDMFLPSITAKWFDKIIDDPKQLSRIALADLVEIFKIQTESGLQGDYGSQFYPEKTERTDKLFEYIWEKTADRPDLREKYFSHPEKVNHLFYHENKTKLAQWQMEKILSKGDELIETGARPRLKTREVLQILNKQFPEKNFSKNNMIDWIQKKLITNDKETDLLDNEKITVKNIAQSDSIMAIEIPRLFNQRLENDFQRLEFLKYITGQMPRKELHENIVRSIPGNIKPEDLVKILEQAPPLLRTQAILPLLNQLKSKNFATDIYKIILGELYDDKVISSVFNSYLGALPASERPVFLANILASKIGSQAKGVGIDLKPIFDSMGPFGAKAAQKLRVAGIFPPKYQKQLESYFANAQEPVRGTMIKQLRKIFGDDLKKAGIVKLGPIQGSGSINYGIIAYVKHPQTNQTVEVFLRIQKELVDDQIAQEAKNWQKAIQLMQDNKNPEIQRIGSMLDAEFSEIMRTLHSSGIELNMERQRALEPLAKEAYERLAHQPNQTSFEVVKTHPELQKQLIPQKFQNEITILENIHRVAWDELNDMQKTKFAKNVVAAEASAINMGKFDSDPHFQNWLKRIGEQDRMVRIDFDKIINLTPEQKNSLKSMIKILIKDHLNADDIQLLANEFDFLFQQLHGRIDDPLPLIRQVVNSSDFPSSNMIMDRLDFLRNKIQTLYNQQGHPSYVLKLNEAPSAASGSFSRLAFYRDYMSKNDFLKILADNLELNPLRNTAIKVKTAINACLDSVLGKKRR